MASFFRKVLDLLTPTERREMYRLLLAMVAMAFVEVAGISSIMPFMTVLAAPQNIATNPLLSWGYTTLGCSDNNSFLLFLGIVVLCMLVINNAATAFITWRIFNFSWMRNHSLSLRLLRKYIHQPYVFFLNHNTAELEKNIMDEVRVVVVGIFNPILNIIKNSVIISFVFILLLAIDPLLAISVSLALGAAYGLLFGYISKTLNRIGRDRAEANDKRFKAASEALNGIKILKVLGREPYFIDRFSIHSLGLSWNQALKSAISQLPKHAFEVLAFGGILLIVLYFLATGGDMEHVIPILSLYAFAGYRLMPALQTVFTGAAEIRYTMPALNILWRDVQGVPLREIEAREERAASQPTLGCGREIRLRGIEYAYPAQKERIFNGLGLVIPANATVGIVGSTGSGKTTIVDILLGLLTPTDGELLVDGVGVDYENIDCWRKNIGYVPQDIFLTDDTVRRNIAFGVPDEQIDEEKLTRVADMANIHEFITTELPDGYDTITGERGVRLSGGQRQRIGIARALYHDPGVLILDEATSALDNITEDVIIRAIHGLAKKKTIIMIAHRISTLKECDIIFVLDRGRLAAQGSYRELIDSSDYFREIEKLRAAK